jgi:hypothetical protein
MVLKKKFGAVPGKHAICSLHKTATLGTSHIIRKELQCETCSLSGGDRRWFRRGSTGKKMAVRRKREILMMTKMMSIVQCQVNGIEFIWYNFQTIGETLWTGDRKVQSVCQHRTKQNNTKLC